MKWINKTANNETYILIPRDLWKNNVDSTDGNSFGVFELL
jgi:hypothetical protein